MTQATQAPVNVERATKLGPFTGGLHNSSGSGEFIENEELFELTNMEVDLDGSLVNRPQINLFNASGFGAGATDNWSFLGVYLPSDGRKFIVAYLPNVGQVRLVNAATGAIDATVAATKALCCIQYANRLWVIATADSPANGGYFDVPTSSTTTWTLVPTMPRGEAVTQYRDRLWIACGIGATSNTSRCFFSAALDPSQAWGINDYFDTAAGNGQKLVSVVKLGQDLVLFKEHSTHKFTYTTDPRKAELNEVDATIGVPAINCVVVYNNNTIYTLHDNAVYELFQYTYTRISSLISMVQESDLDLFLKDQYGLTLHRDRLFVRYFKNLYVYSLRVKRWSSWVSTRKFSKVVVIPSATVGLDTAYTTSASQSKPGEAYYFQDVRKTDYTGSTLSTAATTVSNNSVNPGTTVNTYTLTPTGMALGDWVYLYSLVFSNGGAGPAVVTPPAGFVQISTSVGSAGDKPNQGSVLTVHRKKWVTGEVSYVVNLDSLRTVRASAFVIRGGGDDVPIFGPYMAARGPLNPCVITVPGIPKVAAKSLVIAYVGQNTGSTQFIPPPTLDGSTTDWFSNPAGSSAMSSNFSTSTYNIEQATVPTTVSYPTADNGLIIAVQMAIPPLVVAADPSIEVFQGRLTSKTYDFDMPQSYKVLFWWGIAVATSGKFTGSLNIPNANKNFTYNQMRTLYGTWAAAQAASIKWSNNASISIPDTITPTLGGYARKFIKLLKKVRFRQIYFTVVFDVVSNGGVADATLRVYDLTIFLKQKQTVVRETS